MPTYLSRAEAKAHRRHPKNLEEPRITPDRESSHPRFRQSGSGTLSSRSSDESMPVVDPGMSVDPESLGAQFLRDATEQDNFESSAPDYPREEAEGLEPAVSQATLETAGQEDVDIPESHSLMHEVHGDVEEPDEDVDLLSSSIREASLFDHPTQLGGTRSPRIHADESTGLDSAPPSEGGNREAREKAQRDALDRLRRQRPRR